MDPILPPPTADTAPIIAPGVLVIDVAPIIEPPAYNINFDIATAAIGTLPSLHPHPLHTNICSLECMLFDCLETLQSMQSEEWGFCRLVEQPVVYTLKSATAWINLPNPGQH